MNKSTCDNSSQNEGLQASTQRQRLLHTKFCDVFGVAYPIMNAPIGTASCPELAAAVSNAGGLGTVAASFLKTPEDIKALIRRIKELTSKPFCVNLLLEWPQEERLKICLEEGVPIISLFWGDPTPHVDAIKASGAKLIQSVGSVMEAVKAAQAGADAVLAQGWEAGGHVIGGTATMSLVPEVVDAIHPTPVISAGGIGDGRGIAAALMLGASAAALGTRFIATLEANVPDIYRRMVVQSSSRNTIYGETFDKGWPNSKMRTLINSTMANWMQAGYPPIGNRPGEGDIVAYSKDGTAIPRYHVTQPHPALNGDQEALALYAGQSVGLVNDIQSASDILAHLVQQTISALNLYSYK